MAEELIDSYVNRPSIADDTKFMTDQLKTVLELFDKVNATKVNLNGAKGMKDVVDAAKKAKAAVDDLAAAKDKLNKTDAAGTKTSLAEAKVKKELALASKAEAQARKENAAAALLEAKLSDQSAKSKAREQKVIDELANEYLQLSKAQRDAALKAKNYALTLGENHPITVQAVKDAKAMHDILLRVDQSVGQSQRNVGNYKSAFDGLGMSFTQIARELPSLAISAQQFALAISNNLPMVADEIAKAKAEIAALRAEGQQVPGLFKRVVGSLLTFQVFLSVGIALLTAYAGKISEWASSLFKGSDGLYEAAKRQEELNKMMVEGAKSAGDEIAHLRVLEKTATDLSQSQKVRLQAAKELQELYPNYLKNVTQEAILNGEAAKEINAVAAALLNKAIAQAAEQKAAELGAKKLDLQLKEIQLNKDLAKAKIAADKADQASLNNKDKYRKEEIGLDQFTTKAKKAELDKQIRDNKAAQKQIDDDLQFFIGEAEKRQGDVFKLKVPKSGKDEFVKFFTDPLEKQIEKLNAFAEIEEFTLKNRLRFIEEANKTEQALLKGKYQDDIKAAKGNTVQLFEIRRKFLFDLDDLEENHELRKTMLKAKEIERQRELDKQYNQQFYDDQAEQLLKAEELEQKRFETRKNYLEENRDILLKALDEERNAKIQSASGDKERQEIEEKYNRKRKQVELDTNIAIIQSSLATAEAKLKIAEQDPKVDENQITKLKAAIAALKEELAKLKGAKIDIDIDEATDKLKKLAAAVQEIGSKLLEILSAIGNVINANVDREKNAVQEQIDQLDEKKEKEIEAVESSASTQEEKARRIQIIEAKAAAQKEALERRQRQLDLQRARFDKARSITEAIIRTTVAVIEGLIKGGPILAAVYGAIGAAQIATAIAAPLPKFKDGRQKGPATLGWVGDGGVSEVVTSPDLKQAFITPDTDTLTFLPKDWKVFPDVDDFQEAAMGMMHKPLPAIPIIQHNDNDRLVMAMAYEIGTLKNAIMNKKENHWYMKNGEFRKTVQTGNSWDHYIQSSI